MRNELDSSTSAIFPDGTPALTASSYFAIVTNCYHHTPINKKELAGKYLLPDLSSLCQEESFANISLAWSQEGIEAQIKVKSPIRQVFYPAIDRGDSVELFFDTRDVKTSGWNTAFCHRFFFLPQPVDDVNAGENTHFRTEEMHELCNSNELQVEVTSTKNSYTLYIFIPSICLHGYDPAQFNRLGFTYRINRYGGTPQHFSAVSADYAIEQQPSLWSSLKLLH